jgi:ribosomal protein S18 acetylase RimI-like enzyme
MSLLWDSIQAFDFLRRQQGWYTAFTQAMQFLREPFFEFHRGYLLRRSLREPVHVPTPEVDLSIRDVGQEDLSLLHSILPPLRVKRLARKMQAGEICSVAIKGEQVVAYVLAGFANTPSTDQIRLELGPREAYLWAGYALPAYRRQGVVRAVNLSLCRLLRERGFERALLLVEDHNKASLGHCYKMGYSVTDRILYLRILRWGVSHVSPAEKPTGGPDTERV